MIRALIWKELREQVDRAAPATLLLAGSMSLLIHARFISVREVSAVLLMFGGMILSILLMVAPVPSEKSGGTIDFLLALPVHRRHVWFAKWFSTGVSILVMYVACLVSGVLTARLVGVETAWMVRVAAAMCVSMLAYHSLFFLFLPRVRHELDAAMYAFFLAIITLIWSAYVLHDSVVLRYLGHLAPVAPAFVVQVPPGEGQATAIGTTLLTALLWIVAPGVWLLVSARRRIRS